jgi:2-keto-3-deoxy-L-rhamnonate aldolase RhmA
VKWLRERILNKKLLVGTFLNLGSSLTAEIAGNAGFDWLLIDLEHGAGNRQELLFQLQAIESTPAVPFVRIAWNDPIMFKQVLDLGASGIMVPYIQTVQDAERAVAAMRYPPAGIRGVAVMNRACGFGPGFDGYFHSANSNLATILQIESAEAIKNLDQIAAVDGADVLFVGPMDLSVGLGVPQQWDHPSLRSALAKVVNACQKSGKAAGMIVMSEEQIEQALADGFTMLAYSSDSAAVVKGMKSVSESFRKHGQTAKAL